MNLRVTISIDDVHPQKGWRILGDPTEKWLRTLNEQFGAKFTLFIPSNYHGQYPLSEHKGWVQELMSIEWLELAAHGHFHMTSDPNKYGECEFTEIIDNECKYRIRNVCMEWYEVIDTLPSGWKNPGWLIHPNNLCYIDENFKYVSLHYEHNHGLKWNCKEFYGHNGIQQTDIEVHNGDMIMYTSHIFGDWNDNVWSQENFEQLQASLEHLQMENKCQFKTLEECM